MTTNETKLDPPPPDDPAEAWLSGIEVEPRQVIDGGLDPRPPWRVRRGLAEMRRALRLQSDAFFHQFGQRDEARREIRAALSAAAASTYWLEGTEFLTNAHFVLHSIGEYALDEFSEDCHLEWTGSRYEHTCPVPIAHKRFGFSPGLIVEEVICSLCGQDAAECTHLPHHLYRVRGGQKYSQDGNCPVCLQKKCDHDPDTTYLVTPTSRISKITHVEEISIVATPVQPEARLRSVPVETEALKRHLGPEFEAGMKVTCSECAQACQGFTYMSQLDKEASDQT